MDSPVRENIPGTVAIGMVPFKTASALEAEAEKREAEAKEAARSSRLQSSLSAHIASCWSKAKRAKEPVERQALKNQRQRAGVYEVDKSAAIDQMGGSKVYVLLTATKCRAAEAWLNDMIRPGHGERTFGLKPTPISDLPPERIQSINAEAQAVAQEVLAQAQALQQVIPPAMLQEELENYRLEQLDKAKREIQEEAAERAERMALKIEDIMAEGGWDDALWAVISDLVTLPAGILKGPVIRRKKVQKYIQGPDGAWTPGIDYEYVPQFVRVSPYDLYPAPDSRHPDDGYLIERHMLTRTDLQAMIGVPGYSEQAIRAALKDYGAGGLYHSEAIDSERATLEFSGATGNPLQDGDKIEALEFWGSVQGSMLKDWGIEDLDEDLDYEINAWRVGDHVIRAVLNPDKLGRKPYSVDSWERVPGSFWGHGVPELMADTQDVCNSVARSIVNNAQIASGPQVEVNIDRCESDNEEIWPWKIWPATNSQMNDSPAIRFNQPNCIIAPLLQCFEFFAAMSEDQTGIPRWAYGNTQIGGAGSTSSGLSMLMTYAARGIKEVAYHIDKMQSGCVERLFDYLMQHDPDESIKGDVKVVVRGSTASMAREQRLARANQFLATTANPMDSQILGLEGRAKLLASIAKDMELDVEDLVPDKEGLKELIARVQQQQAALLAAGQNPGAAGAGVVPAEAQQQLDPAGNPAGGTDMNVSQHIPAAQGGVSPNGL